jgi:sugar/nucleoside kinase (ribokinase family)
VTTPLAVGTGLIALDVVFRGHAQEPVRSITGGTCGNVLSILRYLGWKTVPVARLADDRARAAVQADFDRWGIDTRFLSLEPQRPTPIVVQRLLRDAAGNALHRYSWTCPCCGAWLPRYVPVNAASVEAITKELPAPTVFFFDRPSRGALKLAEAYSEQNTLVVFEPSARGDVDVFAPALAIADIVKYSDQRFATLPRHRAKNGRLEIQTLGADGLRFRVARNRKQGAWHKLPASHSVQVVDTAGAGDWCTAGLLKQIGMVGRESFESATVEEIRAALRYGQALASWSCRFEGARGGMYEQSKRVFEREVDALLRGATPGTVVETGTSADTALGELCPSCPTITEHVVEKGRRHETTRHH